MFTIFTVISLCVQIGRKIMTYYFNRRETLIVNSFVCEDLPGPKPSPPHLRSLLGAPPAGLPLQPLLTMPPQLAVLVLPRPPAAPAAREPSPPLPRRSPPPPRNRKTRGRLRTPSPVTPARLSPEELVAAVRPYLLTRHQMLQIGYPVEVEPNSNKASFYVSLPPPKRPFTSFDVNAPEFVPAAGGTPDSGHGSGDASPLSGSDEEAAPGAEEHVCARCDSLFRIGADGKYLTDEQCIYHWGRLVDSAMTCCKKPPGSGGCTTGSQHVWNGTKPGLNGPIDGYVRARTPRGGLFAIDTEMCYTTKGLELVSVAFVRPDGQLAYKANVRPSNPVVCANTRFSGVRPRDIERATKSLRDVQSDIMGFVGSDTVLVGHALDNDLRALKLLHTTVVDTCALYPHPRGFPLRRSLRVLCRELLQRDVQAGAHSALEDARAALDLVLLRAHADRAAAPAAPRY